MTCNKKNCIHYDVCIMNQEDMEIKESCKYFLDKTNKSFEQGSINKQKKVIHAVLEITNNVDIN